MLKDFVRCQTYTKSGKLLDFGVIHSAPYVVQTPAVLANFLNSFLLLRIIPGFATRSLLPLVSSGQRRDSDTSVTKPRGFEQSISGPVITYTRSLTTVLKHLSSLIERKGQVRMRSFHIFIIITGVLQKKILDHLPS